MSKSQFAMDTGEKKNMKNVNLFYPVLMRNLMKNGMTLKLYAESTEEFISNPGEIFPKCL